MQYKMFQQDKLSALGLGCMRLPVVDKNSAAIDETALAEMVAYAMEKGINYFDTAWAYHGGNSEAAMGRALKAYPRESFRLASKFPGYDEANRERLEEIFEEQLRRCGVDYFDYYLFHNVADGNIDGYLDPKHGIYDYLMKQKAMGRIRHLGFSTHGSLETMERFLQAYGEGMEFCQIQLNWLDWTYQNAKEKVELLNRYQIPIWVMEPLRGGKLAALTAKDEGVLRAANPGRSVPEWGFRFLQGIPGVTMILSGMSNFEQLKENMEIFADDQPLTEEERRVLLGVAAEMTKQNVLPCTGCRYCVSECPQGLDIPRLLQMYNNQTVTGTMFKTPDPLFKMPREKWPTACVGCGSCEKACPQEIRISAAMAEFAGKLKK